MPIFKSYRLRIGGFLSSLKNRNSLKTFFLLSIAMSTFLFAYTKIPRRIDPEEGLSAFSADSLIKHVKVLASDEFEGRKPFTPAETKTINYLRDQFKALGLQPANGKSFFQEVPMVSITTTASPLMSVDAKGGSFTLKGFDDYVIWTDKTDQKINVENAEVIFAGYGVVAPEYNWNDYKGLDV